MRVEKTFEVNRSRDEVVDLLCRDETLLALLPGETEIVASEGDHRTMRTHYRALGRDGVATFDFTFLMDGNIRFQKVCDGRIWRELSGEVLIVGGGPVLRLCPVVTTGIAREALTIEDVAENLSAIMDMDGARVAPIGSFAS